MITFYQLQHSYYYKLRIFFSQLQVFIVAESMIAVRKAAVIFKLYVASLVAVVVAML